jgi:hypothetical protein
MTVMMQPNHVATALSRRVLVRHDVATELCSDVGVRPDGAGRLQRAIIV